MLHVTRRGAPAEVILFGAPSKSVGGTQWYAASLNDSWRVAGRLTLNLGGRFDRYRLFFPAQEHRAGESGDRSWTTERFPAVGNVADWNAFSPRLGMNYTLTSDGRTVVKLTYAKYWLPPGTDLLSTANANSSTWYERHGWKDDNGNTLWDPGEETEVSQRSGGAAVESLDPDIKLEFVREVTARIEREIAPNTSLETGVIWRDARLGPFRQDATVPYSAFTKAITVIDPGVDGILGTSDDGRSIVVKDLPEPRPDPSYVVRNVNARNDYVTWEVNARRRMHRRWSLVAGFSHTWTHEHANAYFGQNVRANVSPLTPNDLINTADDGRHEFRVWSARAYGTYDGPWGLTITPYLRHQSGQPYGRTFTPPRLSNLNASINVLAEPIGTRRMDHITLLDVRVAKTFSLGAGRRLSAFIDGFNLLNANPAQSINFASGAFQRPLAIVPPRVARIGVKLQW